MMCRRIIEIDMADMVNTEIMVGTMGHMGIPQVRAKLFEFDE